MLSRQTEEMRNFILDVSVLDRISAPLADYMTEVAGPHIFFGSLRTATCSSFPLTTRSGGFGSITCSGPWHEVLSRPSNPITYLSFISVRPTG